MEKCAQLFSFYCILLAFKDKTQVQKKSWNIWITKVKSWAVFLNHVVKTEYHKQWCYICSIYSSANLTSHNLLTERQNCFLSIAERLMQWYTESAEEGGTAEVIQTSDVLLFCFPLSESWRAFALTWCLHVGSNATKNFPCDWKRQDRNHTNTTSSSQLPTSLCKVLSGSQLQVFAKAKSKRTCITCILLQYHKTNFTGQYIQLSDQTSQISEQGNRSWEELYNNSCNSLVVVDFIQNC